MESDGLEGRARQPAGDSGPDSLLYVEPLYIRAENGQLPELQRVIASYSDRVVMGETLDSTMHALFGPEPVSVAHQPSQLWAPVRQPLQAATVKAPQPPSTPAAMGNASSDYSRALDALKSGDWAGFGQQMDRLGRDLGRTAPNHEL